jgi:3-oxoadipate enol-lactonase
MEKATVNGVSIAYQRRGKGIPLVLMHGYPLDHSIWNEVALLLDKSFDLILPDLRGFGQSAAVGSDYTVADMAADMAGLVDHLKVQNIMVAGHSMGGYIALAFARAYPKRVLGLGLVSTQSVADTAERKEGRYQTARQVAEQGVAVIAGSMPQKLSPDQRVQDSVAKLIRRQPVAGIVGALKALAGRPDSTSLLAAFGFPVVIVHGDADALIPIERAREVKAAIPQAHLVELHGAGHMPMMENPTATAEALSWLLNK